MVLGAVYEKDSVEKKADKFACFALCNGQLTGFIHLYEASKIAGQFISYRISNAKERKEVLFHELPMDILKHLHIKVILN